MENAGKQADARTGKPVAAWTDIRSKGTLLAKLKLDQIFPERMTSNFDTAEELFDGRRNNGFMPMTTLLNPSTERALSSARTKLRSHQSRSEMEEEAYGYCRESRLRKTVIREAYHLFRRDNYDETVLNSRSVVPSVRDSNRHSRHKPFSSKLREQTQAEIPKAEPYETIRSHTIEPLSKKERTWRIGKAESHKLKKQTRGKGKQPVSDSITGWNWPAGNDEALQQLGS